MKSIKINLARYESMHGLLAARGAPRHMLRHSFEIVPNTLSASRHPSFKPVLPSEQLAAFAKMLRRPCSGTGWLAIGSPDGDTTALLCALAVMTRAMDTHTAEPSAYARPLLHPIYGGRYDKLRDDAQYRTMIGGVGLLVISNVAVNSTPDKIEKCRDLLTQWSSIPRVVVVDGADPLAFCIDHLYMRPNKVLFLGKTGRVEKQL